MSHLSGSHQFQVLTFVPIETEEMVAVLLAKLRPLLGLSPSDIVPGEFDVNLQKNNNNQPDYIINVML